MLFSIAGNWLFSGRRWLDPEDSEDRIILDLKYENLLLMFPAFGNCPKAHFFRSISAIRTSWSRRINFQADQVGTILPERSTDGMIPVVDAGRVRAVF
jgi:hypothetical protein